MITKEDLLSTEFYNDWVKPQENIIGGGGAVIERGLTSSALFGGNIRDQDRDQLEPQWMELVHLILPMLQSGWRINRLLAALELEKFLPTNVRTSNAAVLLADQRDRPVYANEAAENLLVGGGVIKVTKTGRLRISGMAYKLDDFLKNGLSNFSELTLSDQSRVWIGKLLPSTFEALDFSFNLDRFTPDKMIVVSSQREKPDHVALLQRTFGLTVAEAEVALLLSEGYDVNEISDMRAVSRNTVRFQVKATLEKVGVRRQTQLALAIAKLVSF